jgi:hypothetical protein
VDPKAVAKELKAYVDNLQRQRIPENPPALVDLEPYRLEDPTKLWDLMYKVQNTIRHNYGMYAVLTAGVLDRLAEYLKGKKVLEVMAGAGWLAKGLSDRGITVKSTDDFSWEGYLDWKRVFPIEQLDVSEAVDKYMANYDVLIVSWPHYIAKNLIRVMQQLPEGTPVVYIGEGAGGCCAGEKFFDYFEEESGMPIFQWPGMYDYISIGKKVTPCQTKK